MELISQDVDITGLQVVNVSMSAEEIATLIIQKIRRLNQYKKD